MKRKTLDIAKRVSASIVTYQTDREELRRCMGCLKDNGIERVWIIDNSPTRALQTLFAAQQTGFPADITYVHTGENRGFGAAHNIAIREAITEGFEFHLVLNSDVEFAAETVELMIERMDREIAVGQISPEIVSSDGSSQYSQRLLPTPLDVFGRRFLPAWMMRSRNRRYMLTFRRQGSEADIPYHQGSFMLFRTSALQAVGGFDERFFMYPEDIDITRRIHRQYRTLYYPAAKVVHHHRAASYHNWRMTWIHCINMGRYFNKYGWLFDAERRRVNRLILKNIPRLNN